MQSLEVAQPVKSAEIKQSNNGSVSPDTQRLLHLRKLHEKMVGAKTPKEQAPQVVTGKERRRSDSGKEYEFYEFQLPSGEPIRVVFKGREEIVDVDAFREGHIVIMGGEPQHLPREKYGEWQASLNGKDGRGRIEGYLGGGRLAEYANSGGLAIVVNQNPESLTETALLLGTSDPKVREMYQQARKFQYSDELIDLIDKAIAVKEHGVDGDGDLLGESHDAEALVLASLLGDKAAADKLSVLADSYSRGLEEDERKRTGSRDDFIKGLENELKGSEPYPIESLVAVHTTKYYPYFDSGIGRWRIKTRFGATEGRDPRTSVHFALNHVVESHMEGNWQETPVVIVAPLKALVAANGAPQGLAEIDTYWDLNPGQDLILPEGTYILAPGRTNGEKTAEAPNGALSHKGPDAGAKKLNYPIFNTARLNELRRNMDWDKWGANDEEQIQIKKGISEEIDAIGKNRDEAVNALIEQMGYEVKRGGNRNWGGDYASSNRILLLAQQLGADYGAAHYYSPEGSVESAINLHNMSIEQGEKIRGDPNFDEIRDFIKDQWDKLPAQQRRESYVMGLI